MKRPLPPNRSFAHFVGAVSLLGTLLLGYSLLPGSHTLSSAPTVSSNAIPTILAAQHYINRTLLTIHTTAAFDSSAGDLIVVCASSHSGVLMTPSDTFKNTWTSAAGPTSTKNGFDLRTQVWYAKNPKVGPSHTVTIELSSSQALVISLLVVRGSNTSDPIDAISAIGDDGGSMTPHVAGPSVTTTSRNDLLIGFAKSSTGQVWNSGSDYKAQGAASSSYLTAETGLAETPGSYRSTFDLSSPGSWQSITLAIKPALDPRLVSSSSKK